MAIYESGLYVSSFVFSWTRGIYATKDVLTLFILLYTAFEHLTSLALDAAPNDYGRVHFSMVIVDSYLCCRVSQPCSVRDDLGCPPIFPSCRRQ